MHPLLLVRVLGRRAALAERDRWPRERLLAYQAEALAEVRAHASAASSFYRRLHAGLEGAPLSELPIVTKGALMASFDEAVTDPDLRREDLAAWLATAAAGDRYRGRYQVAATSGSSGTRGLFAWNPEEWADVIASYARAQVWAGVGASLFRRSRMAVVSSKTPWHQSAVVAATVDSGFLPTLRLDANQPLDELCAALDAFQPASLVAYASMSRVLAEAQLAGRLHIRPTAVMCASEVLTRDTRARVHEAWGTEPFEVYAATEPAGIASACERHRLHLYEDLVVPEVVDEAGNPVPPGTWGARLLVTVLFARTLPLIRYELDDRVLATDATCDCGRPFALVGGIEGRTDEVLSLAASGGGSVSVHPVLFHGVLEAVLAAGWQVVWDGNILRVLVERPSDPLDAGAWARRLAVALAGAGAAPPPIAVEAVEAVPRGASGKRRMVVRAGGAADAGYSAPTEPACPTAS